MKVTVGYKLCQFLIFFFLKWCRWPRAVIYWNKSSQQTATVPRYSWKDWKLPSARQPVTLIQFLFVIIMIEIGSFWKQLQAVYSALSARVLESDLFWVFEELRWGRHLGVEPESCCWSSRCEVSQPPRCHHGSRQGHTEVKTPRRPSSIFRPVSCAEDAASASSASSFFVSLIWSILKNV